MERIQQFFAKYKFVFVVAILLSLAQWSSNIFLYWRTPSGYGIGFGTFILLNSALVFLFLIYVPIAFFFGDRQKLKSISEKYVIYLLCYVILGFLFLPYALQIADEVRIHRFRDFAAQNMFIVDAIYQYVDDKGFPPAELRDLVPEYLQDIPNNVMGMEVGYKYELNGKQWIDNPWSLFMQTPVPFLDNAQFIYLPMQNYPDDVQILDEWGYLGIR